MFKNRIVQGKFEHSCRPIDNKQTCVVHNTDHGRYYEVAKDVYYPSITTVLSESTDLGWWREMKGEVEANRIMKTAAARGNQMHDLLERYIANEPICTNEEMPSIKSSFLTGREAVDKIDHVYFQEKVLLSNTLRVAGRVDVVGKYDSIPSIIDFKTSNKIKLKENITNYFCQATAYSIMCEEMFGLKTDQIVIIIFIDNIPAPSVFVESSNAYIGQLTSKINDFKGHYK